MPDRHTEYNRSDRGRARSARYERSDKGRERVERYRSTHAGAMMRFYQQLRSAADAHTEKMHDLREV